MKSEDVVKLLRKTGVLKLLPRHLKLGVKSRLDFKALNRADWRQTYDEIMARAKPSELATDKKVCIVYDWMLRHAYYEAACKELGVPYDILDLTTPDWIEKAKKSDYCVYFLRPFVLSSTGRTIYEERAHFLKHVLKKNLFPHYDELWAYESKRRCAGLLECHDIPHPATSIFFDKREAIDFLKGIRFPLVFKTDIGSDAIGVRIVRNADEGKRIVNRCFGRGFKSSFFDPRDRTYDQVLFQEHVGDVVEWRVIRIGESFFAYKKGKKGEFHSGSKIVDFSDPPKSLLDFSRDLLEKLGMTCMSLDIFEDNTGRLLVNELQAYYGANETGGYYFENGKPVTLVEGQTIEMMVNGEPGRYLWDDGTWRFEEGDFSRNAGCNLRVKLAFKELGQPLPGWGV